MRGRAAGPGTAAQRRRTEGEGGQAGETLTREMKRKMTDRVVEEGRRGWKPLPRKCEEAIEERRVSQLLVQGRGKLTNRDTGR